MRAFLSLRNHHGDDTTRHKQRQSCKKSGDMVCETKNRCLLVTSIACSECCLTSVYTNPAFRRAACISHVIRDTWYFRLPETCYTWILWVWMDRQHNDPPSSLLAFCTKCPRPQMPQTCRVEKLRMPRGKNYKCNTGDFIHGLTIFHHNWKKQLKRKQKIQTA